MSLIWNKVSDTPPNCYKTGNWDGKMSDTLLLSTDQEKYSVGVAYARTMDGSKFLDFYSSDYRALKDVTYWAVIPSIY